MLTENTNIVQLCHDIYFIIPSARWEASAGVRIRYKRLKPFFEAANTFIDVVALENLTHVRKE